MKINRNNALAILRVSLGFIFLWVFLDKTFGLGFSTTSAESWLAGNSPTSGFLTNGTHGPFESIFANLAGSTIVDWLFMMGMLGVGLALILGIGMLAATISGSLQMLLIYISVFPPENNPIIDEHIIYTLVLWTLFILNAQDYYGFGKRWRKTSLVKKYPWLK